MYIYIIELEIINTRLVPQIASLDSLLFVSSLTFRSSFLLRSIETELINHIIWTPVSCRESALFSAKEESTGYPGFKDSFRETLPEGMFLIFH